MAELLEQAAAGTAPAVVLIEGDEYLARTGARELAAALVPEKDRGLNLLVLDAAAGAREIASHLVTVAMFAAPKAVVVEGGEAFAEELDAAREIARARELWQGKRQRDAARRLLKLVRPAGWGAAELALGTRTGASAARWRKDLGAAPEEADKSWLQELSAYAVEQGLSAPPEDLEVLVKAVERGLPPKTHLILVAESLPPKHALVQAVGEGDTAKALQLFGDELRRKANASAVALPFLGGVASAVRKALADSARYAGSGERELGYNEFQAKLFPALEEELSAKKQKVPHPFAAWLGYKRSRRRPRAFWRRALVRCAEVDFELKDGADPRLSLERLLVEVCAR